MQRNFEKTNWVKVLEPHEIASVCYQNHNKDANFKNIKLAAYSSGEIKIWVSIKKEKHKQITDYLIQKGYSDISETPDSVIHLSVESYMNLKGFLINTLSIFDPSIKLLQDDIQREFWRVHDAASRISRIRFFSACNNKNEAEASDNKLSITNRK